MTVTRRSLAETYETQDLIIQAAQDAKREATKAYREQLDRLGMDKDAVKAEVDGFKKAFRRKMDGQKKGTEAVEHVDAIADEIYLEITSPAPRATRVAIDVPSFVALTTSGHEYHYDAETGEVTEPQPTKAAGQGQAGSQAADSGDESNGSALSLPDEEAAPSNSQSQAAPQPESDLTSPSLGQVATHTPETEAPYVPQAFSIGPLEPREAGGLKGFGFTVNFGNQEETRADRIKKLRPNCQQPERCRSSGGKAHCFTCVKAAEESAA